MRSLVVLTVLALALCLASGCGGKRAGTNMPARTSEQQPGPAAQLPIAEAPAPAPPQPATDTTAPAPPPPAVTEQQVGFPLYPGAAVSEAFPEEAEEGAEVTYKEVHLASSDAFDKVAAFYRGKFPSAKVTAQADTPDLKILQLEWKENSGKKMVIVSRDRSNRTKIVLARLDKAQ